jgi:squalene synthase HpnC
MSVKMQPICDQVKNWYPKSNSAESYDSAAAECYTRELATSHYENFPLASVFLPKRLHQHFYNVYAFCRWADDLGDEMGDTETSLKLLSWWRAELQSCFAGECQHPVFVALKPTIDQFSMSIDPFDHLIQAFEQDQRITEYETFEQLLEYCERSANPVGRLVLTLFDCASAENILLSDSICTGLQLANFWQDVARDLKIPRVYLPAEDLAHFSYSRDELNARKTTPAFLKMMRFQVDRARGLLEEGLPLVGCLPGRLQVDIELFARGGLCILRRIERVGYQVLKIRPVVTKLDFAVILVRCLFSAFARKLNPRRWFS